MSRFKPLIFLTASLLGSFAQQAKAVDFEKEVAPFLEQKCLGCHNPNVMKGDLSMITKESILAAGDDILVPSNSYDSVLHMVTVPFDEGEKPEMPEKGDPLTKDEADLLAAWIDAGAEWPEGLILKEASKADKSWWAYQPLAEPSLDSIDDYIRHELTKLDLDMNPEADRRSLIRRVTYDLWGLPPTEEAVAEFVADKDPRAYERLIDRLLGSPHYGERWGRHWLDVIRFGESKGYERNAIIDDLWPFRDYIIQSINEDKPFDRLILEHLAGDVIGEGQPEVEIGSAFLVAGPYDDVTNLDLAQVAQIRANTMDEIINATGESFLAMTLACARCHDHKFDPIAQADYYGLYATFAGIRHGSVDWASSEEKERRLARVKPLEAELEELEDAKEALSEKIIQRGLGRMDYYETLWPRPPANRVSTEETFEPIAAKYVRFICEAQDVIPTIATNFKMDEFEVWSSGTRPVNVALSENGGVATGVAKEIKDFADAFGPRLLIDGLFGEQFISLEPELVIELSKETLIDRVRFSSARQVEEESHRNFIFVADYRIEVSSDGKSWKEVANSADRKPSAYCAKDENGVSIHAHQRLLKLESTDEESVELSRISERMRKVRKAITEIPEHPTLWMGERNQEEAEGPFHLFIGGNPQKPGDEVLASSVSTLDEVVSAYELDNETDEGMRRRRLAEWITHPDNPLTPRVLANRIWQHHFGIGIVDTPNDFGYMGSRPTHPELLDFLAHKLKENDWRIKDIHRMILMSETYRQSSDWRADGANVDADSRFLWRFPPRRLSAEEIRDTILFVSGELDTNMGGPGFRLYEYFRHNVATYRPLDEHGPETYRRAVYHQNARASVVDLMTEFDLPDCAFSVPERSETTTPLQALTLLNHSFTVDMAESFAGRVKGVSGNASDELVVEVFRLAYQRDPEPIELKRSIDIVDTLGLRALCRAVINSSELIYLD